VDCVGVGTGEHRPPGQQPAEVTLTGVQQIGRGGDLHQQLTGSYAPGMRALPTPVTDSAGPSS
jgi:hypothetical protein